MYLPLLIYLDVILILVVNVEIPANLQRAAGQDIAGVRVLNLEDRASRDSASRACQPTLELNRVETRSALSTST